MKLKSIALAALLAAAGVAHAAIDNGQTGDGSLVAHLAYGSNTVGSSASFDLGLSFSQVATWQVDINAYMPTATKDWVRSWNLSTGEYSGTGLTTTTIGNYGTYFADFKAGSTTADAAVTQLSVWAFDGSGNNAGDRAMYITGNSINNTTGGPVSLTSPTNTVLNGVQSGTNIINFQVGLNNSGTHKTDANGANLASAGSSAYFNDKGMDKLANTGMFDTNGQINGSYVAGTTTFASGVKSIAFYKVTSSSITGTQRATTSAIGFDQEDTNSTIDFDNNGSQGNGTGDLRLNGTELGLWTLQGDTLSFTVTAVPEPETYAMLLAGLGLMGAVARRRRNKA